VDEAQQFELFSGQHICIPPLPAVPKDSPKQIMNRQYMFDMCSATI